MYSAYKLSKQSDSIQPWGTPFLIWNPSVVPCPVLTVASWTAYRFLRRQVRWVWYSQLLKNFPQFVMTHTVRGFGVINKAEVDVFLEVSCFFNDPADVGNLISGSSAFSKTKNTQDWSPLEWTGWISLQFKGLSRVFSNTTVQSHRSLFALVWWSYPLHPPR